jgi:hypothetical protein
LISIRLQTWLIVGGLAAVVFASNPYAFLPDSRGPHADQPRPDFLAFYAAGTLLREDPAHLYDQDRQAQVQARAFGERIEPDLPGFMPFVYPAAVALLFVPLSWLPYSYAFIAMLAANVLLWGLALNLLVTRFGLSLEAGRLLVLCSAVSFPVILTLANGQVSFLAFLIMALVVADIRKGNPRAGIWAGFLAFKPTLAPVLAIWFLARKNWRALGYAAAAGIAVLVVSLVLVGNRAIPDLWNMSSRIATEQYASANVFRMPNIRALVAFLGYGYVATALVSLLVLIVLLAQSRETSDASCAALILATILLASHIHFQDLTLLWIIVAMILSDGRKITAAWRWGLFSGSLVSTAAVFRLTAATPVPVLSLTLLLLFLWFTLRPNVAVGGS